MNGLVGNVRAAEGVLHMSLEVRSLGRLTMPRFLHAGRGRCAAALTSVRLRDSRRGATRPAFLCAVTTP